MRQEAAAYQPLQKWQLNTAAPQQFKQRGDAAAEHRRLFSYPKPKTNNFYRRKAAESEDIIWHFSTAQ
ncbi:hypothetical protein ACO1BY_11585 [Clostridioides difficile]|uniref:hypothetical protein n=1 Tax=Clostridioides difficile TaxID=1496 RepID=UPI003A4FA741|nr:hypothetical protein [Clostridioides difficile]